MGDGNRLNVVLFALTGFGNPVLESLLADHRVEVGAVFTVTYDDPFPYYQERQLIELCHLRQVTCYPDVKVNSEEGHELLVKHAPDLIIVATFKQILKEKVLSLPKFGVVNAHPSLLPRYRGPCPSNAALLNGEQVTGVTFHYVNAGLDDGDILLQRSNIIDEKDNDGLLRQKLAWLAGDMIPELIGMFAGFTRAVGTRQNHALASYAPKPTVEDGYLERANDIQTICRKMKAFNPIPGTSILVDNKRVPVDRFELLQVSRPEGLYEDNDVIEWAVGTQAIRLFKNLDYRTN